MKGKLGRGAGAAIVVIGLAMVAYHMVYVQVLLQSSFEHRVTHLAFALLLTFLSVLRGAQRHRVAALGLVFVAMTLFSMGYIRLWSDHIESLYGFAGPVEAAAALMLIILVLEGTRRDWGITLPILAVVSLAYLFWGHLLPQGTYFYHSYIPMPQALAFVALESGGAMGGLLLASADYIFLFVIFGGLIGALGTDRFFNELSKALGKRLTGAGGLSAVVSSGLVGMVTGVAMSNVLITGAFTIPAMRSQGYTREQAGAIEAVASTGGQIMPPVLGLGAFVMVTLAGVPYVEIVIASIIPAILYYLVTYLGVRVMALKANIHPPPEPVSLRALVGSSYLFLVPVGVLVVLLAARHSIMYTAFYVIVISVVLAYVRKQTRPEWRELIRHLVEGAQSGASVAVAIAAIGIIVQGMTTTGLGGKITAVIMSMGDLPSTLVAVALIGLFLGLGMPTPAAYALTAALGAPVLIKMGVPALAAHMFILYYASLSSITPPVAAAVLVGARLAEANFWKCGIEAMRLAYSLYLLPFLWVFESTFLMQFTDPLTTVVSLLVGTVSLSLTVPVLQGWALGRVALWERGLYALSALSLFWYLIDKDRRMLALGALLFLLTAVHEWRKRRRSGVAQPLARVPEV
ncbi:MAG: TRAP transporter fused permease subunit [Candidatus Rokubacteria bacterium]|nr:TRAP transporter fused permease subunit [Candidatus Rokubacteria bacterium]